MSYRVVSRALMIVILFFVAELHAAGQELSGTGQWQSGSGDAMQGTWSVDLTEEGSALHGALKLTGSNVLSGGSVTGSINGQQVTLGVLDDGVTQATFSGALTDGTVSGEWQCQSIKDSGVWFGTLQVKQTKPTATTDGPSAQ